jgi:competence protein ComFC
MYCILCHRFSYKFICKKCQKAFLTPNQTSRTLSGGFKVYSFYKYKEIEELLKTKHTHIGAEIYKILAENSFRVFKKSFYFEDAIDIVPVDDIPKSGYAHTAILAQQMKTKHLRPYFNALRAQNDVSYSGKSLQYRQNHSRHFKYQQKRFENVILVDDIVTTGTTLSEAKNVVEKSGAKALFALTLADASDL